MAKTNATIKDVARAAKLSVATVSRALNGHGNVTDLARDRVLQVAKQLAYIPNHAARSLSSRRTHTIGVVLPDLVGEFFSELIRGVDTVAREQNLHLLVSSYHGHPEQQALALAAMRGRVDGLLVMSPHIGDSSLLAQSLGNLPTILINSKPGNAELNSFGVDNYQGAQTMMAHLIAKGHREIAFITGPAHNFDAAERLRGYRDAMRALAKGNKAAPKPLELAGDFSEASGFRAGQMLLAQGNLPDAIFAANDMMALGCLFAFNQGNVEVPGQVSITGFDDIPMARFVTPALTTMRVNISDLGAHAMRLLLALQNGEDIKDRLTPLIPELVLRQSCSR